MIDLPQEMRDLLVEQLDEYLSGQGEGAGPEDVAHHIIETFQELAEEYTVISDPDDDILGFLENSGDLDSSLLDVLVEQLETEDLTVVQGEDLVELVERTCEIEWLDEQDALLGVDELDVNEDLSFEDEVGAFEEEF